MALLNIFPIVHAILSPFNQPITIIQQVEVVGNDGRATNTEVIHPNLWANVIAVPPDGVETNTDYTVQERSIDVYVAFPLQGPSPGRQADFVIWHGSKFAVRSSEDYSKGGQGVMKARCDSVKLLDPSPMLP